MAQIVFFNISTTKKIRQKLFLPLSFVAVFGSGIKIRDQDPGWVKIRIRDKHPGSATLGKRVDKIQERKKPGDLDVSDEGLHDPLPLLLPHEVQAGQPLLLQLQHVFKSLR